MRYLRGNISPPFMSRYCSLARSCKDLIAEMVHTKDGSRVAREFLARGTAKVCGVISLVLVCRLMVFKKDRKHIVKVLKPYIETMAKDEDAQYILFTAFDVIEYVVSNCHHMFR
jgi:pumilio family protein 6